MIRRAAEVGVNLVLVPDDASKRVPMLMGTPERVPDLVQRGGAAIVVG